MERETYCKAYKAATIFVDHASRFIHLRMCESTGGEEALQAKLHFEKLARDSGIRIKWFRADKGIFASNSFKKFLPAIEQEITFCGVNAQF